MDHQVVIVGAGVAGLSCARVLKENGVDFIILESSDRPGGRIKTDRNDGYQFDHGFQVLQTGYPEISKHLDLSRLELSAFPAGVAVHKNDAFHVIADPRRHPAHVLSTVASPIGTITDRLRLFKLVRSLVSKPMEQIFDDPDERVGDFLHGYGFSENFITSFFTPFFAGACLDTSMRGSSRTLKYLTRLFSTGDAALPADGMEAISRQLAEAIPEQNLYCRHEVSEVREGRVSLTDGRVIEAEMIVLAVSQAMTARLLQIDIPGSTLGEACLYFSADWQPPLAHPFLVLNGEGEGPVNNIAFPSLVSPGYAPPGKTLIAAVVLGNRYLRHSQLVDLVKKQCAGWFGPEVEAWEHLRTQVIDHALPSQEPPTASPYVAPEPHALGIRICGEYGSLPGLQWALMSGQRTGRSIIKSMVAMAA